MRPADLVTRLLWAVWAVLAFAVPASGQDDQIGTQLWLAYQYQNKIGEHTRVFGALGYEELVSTERFFGDWTRLYLKAGGSFDLGERFRVAIGAGTYYTNQPEVTDQFELRLWQEGTAYWPESIGWVRRFVLVHRLRIEERFSDSDGWDFSMRLRYRLGAKIPLNTYNLEPGSFYLPLAYEWFADLVDESSELFAKRNEATIGLGYVLNERWTLDLSYHRQSSRATIEDGFRTSSHVVEFTVRTSVRIRDLIKNR